VACPFDIRWWLKDSLHARRVRSSLKTGHKSIKAALTLRASSGREQVQQDDPPREATPNLLNDLVGAREQRRRDIDAEHLGRPQVDHQLKLDWRLNGKLARLLAFEDAISIRRRAPEFVENIRTV
jgi:hypothetical protein